MRMRPAPVICALALAAGGLSACGSSDSTTGRIPATEARALQRDIQRVQEPVRDGDCSLASTRVQQVSARLDGLPSSVDAGLVERLRSGVTKLQERAGTECLGARTVTQETTTEPVPTVPTETEPVPTVETTPTVTVPDETEPTTTEEAPAPTTPAPAPTPTSETPAPDPDPTGPDDGDGDGGTGGIAPAF